MDASGTAQGGGSGYGFLVQPALQPQALSNLGAGTGFVQQFLRPGSFPVFVHPKGEQGFWVYGGAIYRRDKPWPDLSLEQGRIGEQWNVVTLGAVAADFYVPDAGAKRTVLVPVADSAASVYAGGVDITSLGPQTGNSDQWLALRSGMKELQFFFNQAVGKANFYTQEAQGTVQLWDTTDLSVAGQIYRGSFPGNRLWVNATAGGRMNVSAVYEVG